MATVLATARIRQRLGSRFGQPKRVVQLAVSQQSGIGGNRGTAKLQPQTTVEIEPQSALSVSPVGSPIAAHSIPRKFLSFNL